MSQRLTRRSFVRAAVGLAGSLLAACSGPEEPRQIAEMADATGTSTRAATATRGSAATPDATPSSSATPEQADHSRSPSSTTTPVAATPSPTPRRRLTIARSEDVPASLAPWADAFRDRLAEALGAAVADDDGDFIVSVSDGAQDVRDFPLAPVDFVAVVSRRLLVRDVSFEELGRLWRGETTDWMDAGSPVSHGVVRYRLQGSSGPLDPSRAEREVASIDDLAAELERERGGLAIIPLDSIDYRLRTLTIDGINPIRPGNARNPLRVEFEVRPKDGQPGQALRSVVLSMTGDEGPTPVSMTWAGDIIFGRLVHVKMVSYGDWAAPFRSIHPELTWADVTISNLECAISDSYVTPTDPTTFDFKTDPPAIAGLQLAHIDILSRANNHSFNFGAIGMRDTTAALDQAGILHFGMGETIHESRKAVVIERGGTTYAFLGYNGISDAWDGAGESWPGTNPMLDWLVVEDVRREVEAGHVVIPFFHWGTEYVYDPTEQQRYFAHVAIQSGAAMVMGSHPHWVQAVETYLGKPIVYSLGNFVFDQEWSRETKEGMIAHVWMRGDKPLSIDLVPILIEDYHKPRRMENWEAWHVLEQVWAASDRIIANL